MEQQVPFSGIFSHELSQNPGIYFSVSLHDLDFVLLVWYKVSRLNVSQALLYSTFNVP